MAYGSVTDMEIALGSIEREVFFDLMSFFVTVLCSVYLILMLLLCSMTVCLFDVRRTKCVVFCVKK